jgi:hypothetical protein
MGSSFHVLGDERGTWNGEGCASFEMTFVRPIVGEGRDFVISGRLGTGMGAGGGCTNGSVFDKVTLAAGLFESLGTLARAFGA